MNTTKITKISVLIFDFCPYKGGPNVFGVWVGLGFGVVSPDAGLDIC